MSLCIVSTYVLCITIVAFLSDKCYVFSSEFDETLKAWQWPFIPVTVKTPIIPKANELREEMGSCFQHLVCLHVPYPYSLSAPVLLESLNDVNSFLL